MFGKKAKELKLELDNKNAEIEALKKKAEELDALKKRVEELESVKQRAQLEADEIIKAANEYSAQKKVDADLYSEKTRSDADAYLESRKTDADIYIERTIFASQSEIKKRKDIVSKLNGMLVSAVAYINEQNSEFTEMLASVCGDNSDLVDNICGDIDKCSCSCEECRNPCSDKKPAEAPASANEAGKNAARSDTPDEYDSPAQLMQSIYHIMKRDLPDNVKDQQIEEEAAKSIGKKPDEAPEPSQINAKTDSELPHDASLADLVSEIV